MTSRPPSMARPVRRDRLLREHIHDPYMTRRKPGEPSACPRCGVVFHKGRWQWGPTPIDAREHVCPACQRVADKVPAGYLTLRGDFFGAHRDEILHLARNTEEKEKAEHPMRRIMDIQDREGEVVVTTTDMQLAREIGMAIHYAYKGNIDYQYTDETNILEVEWSR